MFSSPVQQTISLWASGSHNPPCWGAINAVHHGPGPHSLFMVHQYQQDCLAQAVNLEVFNASQPSSALPHDPQVWSAQVDETPTPDYHYRFLSNNSPASPSSSVTSPFPMTPLSFPNTDQSTFVSLQGPIVLVESFLPLGIVNQQQPSVYDPPTNTWGASYCVQGQRSMFHDQARRDTPDSYFITPRNHLEKCALMLASKELVMPPVNEFRPYRLEKS
jgi:hypothetical protein